MKTIMFPGQGSQFKGMGKHLFDRYPEETALASEILGYDLKQLCLADPDKKLNLTQYTQPALFVVNALAYKEFLKNETPPDYLIGHSLGEYNALLASGVFDFETGIRLVKKRGEIMAEAKGGGMAVVLGITIQDIKNVLRIGGYDQIDIANYNTPTQTVIAGPSDDVTRAIRDFEKMDIKIIALNVSAAFHSRYMKNASQLFTSFLKQFRFSYMQIPVIANKNSQPYKNEQLIEILGGQIDSPVLWTDTICSLIDKGVNQFKEIGGTFLTKMVEDIQASVKSGNAIKPTINGQQNYSLKKRRIFLLPFAGGNRYSYQFLLPHLKHFEVRSLELPGRGKRSNEPLVYSFFDAMGDIYRQISKEIEPNYDVIYGHSLGAILAYWVTYRLEKNQKNPASLVVSGVPRPTIIQTDSLKAVHKLPRKEFVEKLVRMGGMPKGFIESEEFFDYIEPILRADFKLLHSISDCKVGSIQTPIIAVMGTKESKANQIEEWRNFTEGHLECHHLEGDHFFINNHPQRIAELISKSL
ncbi:ACP S-malonyltransferase [Chryseobacterium sp. CBSDS_008]|uniref:ACP S-malonyltransferase n=1 Tax=Chryseobacterium sp. CBSDS_008 TaxID=3415265 RepID=UPI003CEB4BD4